MALSKERRNEIVYNLFVLKMKKEGVGSWDHEAIDLMVVTRAEELGIPRGELYEVLYGVIEELFRETFPHPSIYEARADFNPIDKKDTDTEGEPGSGVKKRPYLKGSFW